MQFRKHLIQMAAGAVSAVMLLSSACTTALAADNTPIGYIEAVPGTVTGADVTSDPNYLIYKGYLEEENGVVSALYNGLINTRTEIDIRDYAVPKENISTLLQVMYHSFPELWYLKSFGYSFTSTNIITKVRPVYLTVEGDLEEMKAAFFDVAKQRYLPLVNDGMDDFTKAVILHDALVLNTHYTQDPKNARGNNYTYMVENYGVCQFYAECYAYLLAQCGIKSEVVSSDSMNHAWLKIQLDGKYYNVDSTWDDPTPDKAGHVRHAYFLYSDSVFQTEDDTMDRDLHKNYLSIHAADSTAYDSFDHLHYFDSEVCYLDGTFYAIDCSPTTGETYLVTYDHRTDAVSNLKKLNFRWSVADQPGYYYIGNYSSLAAYGGKLYYNSADMVYAYDPATGATEEFAAAASSSDNKVLYGLRITDGKLWGVYAPSPREGYIEPTYMRDMPQSDYTVTVDSGITNGTVKADAETAAAGRKVTLEVSPNEGYSVGSVTVNGTALEPENGVYSFTMPNENVTVSAVFTFADSVGARVAGHSLSLQGDIGVNFYMELDSAVADSSTAYMRFTLPTGMDEPTVTTMKVSDAETKTSGDTTYYIFKCAVAAKEMASDIRAQIIDGSKTGTEYTYSVKEYAEYLLDHPEIDGYADAAPVAKAMLNYGAYSQVYFDKASVALANEKLTKEEKDVSGIQAQTINRDDYSVSVPEGTEFLGATLSLKSKTTLSLYFRSGQNLTFSCTGRQLETVNEDGYQIVRLRNIEAKNLSNSFEVNITAGDAQGSVSYSPMNYCYMALKSDNATDALKDVVRALYNYWVAAEAYF